MESVAEKEKFVFYMLILQYTEEKILKILKNLLVAIKNFRNFLKNSLTYLKI